MTQKPIDAHCHLFSTKYVVEEAAAMGWAYVTGNYPHAEVVIKAAPAAESLFSWSRLEDIVKWFFDLGAAVSSYETNYQSPAEACRKGLNLPSAEGLVVTPLMMDIFYMFGPPAGRPTQVVKSGWPVRGRKRLRGAEDRKASGMGVKSDLRLNIHTFAQDWMIQTCCDFIHVAISFAVLYNVPIFLQPERNREVKECLKRSLFL